MPKEKSISASRYDLPSSRILIRSERVQEKMMEAAGPDPEARERLRDRLMLMVRDVFMVRLMEDRRMVRSHLLAGGRRSGRLAAEEALPRLTELNDWAGFPLFALDAWQELGPGPELSQLDYELHLNRFWPPGMPTEILGALWEERLPASRRAGVFYTPRRIVDMIVEETVGNWLAERGESGLTVLDPCAGSGYFILGAFRRLVAEELRRYRSTGDLFSPVLRGETGMMLDPTRRMELVAEHLYGVELESEGIELLRRTLFIEVAAGVKALGSTAPNSLPLFDNFKHGDALIEKSFPQQVDLFLTEQPPALKPFDWRDPQRGFGRIMAAGGFACVIGNPPWVSLKGRHRQAPYTPDVVGHLVRRYSADTYRPNLVEFFIRRAIELLAEGGRHGFVVPDRIAENEQYAGLRRYMSEHGEITRLHFREPFPGVVADTLVYGFVRRQKPKKSARILVTDAAGQSLTAPQGYWLRNEGVAPEAERPDEMEETLKRIESAGRRRLSDFLDTGVGFIARPRRITAERTAPEQRAVIKGEHVTPYHREGQAYFEFILSNLAGGTRILAKLAVPDRILLRKTGARLVAARDRTGDLPEQSLYFAFPRERRLARSYDLNYFVGILNSRMMSFYFRQRRITNRSTTPQIKKVHLDSLPIRPVNFTDPAAVELHDRMAALVGERSEPRPPARQAELDEAIEKTVSELYGLTVRDEEIIREETRRGFKPEAPVAD